MAHPGASAANSSSLKMPRKVSLICACSASVHPPIAGTGAHPINQLKGKKRPASTLGWYNDTHWLGRPPPHSLGSLVASLLRASPGALPWVTRTEKKKRRGMEGTSVNLKLLPCGGSLRARTWTSSGSGIGRDWIRYSICLAFTMRSSTSSFLFAVRFGWSEKEMEYV